MLSSWKISSSGATFVAYDENSNAMKFFLFYNNGVMEGQSSEEKVSSLLGHLLGPAFELYYVLFAAPGELIKYAKNYSNIKKKLFENFFEEDDLQETIHQSLEIGFQVEYILGYLKKVKQLYGRDSFDDIVVFGLVYIDACQYEQLQQFLSSPGPKNYADDLKALMDFHGNRISFSGSSSHVLEVPLAKSLGRQMIAQETCMIRFISLLITCLALLLPLSRRKLMAIQLKGHIIQPREETQQKFLPLSQTWPWNIIMREKSALRLPLHPLPWYARIPVLRKTKIRKNKFK